MVTKLIYKDKAGNKLKLENNKIALRNAENKLVNKKELFIVLRRKGVKDKVSDALGYKFRLRPQKNKK